MPRGLGDDPLSRQRKNSATRTWSSAALAAAPHADDASIPSTVQPSVQNIGETTSLSSSYNDVFFQKRDEAIPAVSAAAATPAPAAVEEPVQAAPIAAPPESPAPEVIVAETIPSPEPAPAIASTLVDPEPSQIQPQPEAQKTGFFSRIFGKLRK